MSLSKCCVEGVRHEGTPEGKHEKIGGVDCYVATPKSDYPKDKALLFLVRRCRKAVSRRQSDVWGIALPNNKLLADDFARNGFYTVVPDLFEGEVLKQGDDVMAFVKKHVSSSHGIIERVIKALHEQGIKTLAAQGYCFGARGSFDFATHFKAIAVNHPSLLQVPEDLEKLKSTGIPLLINSCETDPQFPKESQARADEIFQGDANYKRAYFPGCTHGSSSSRADLTSAGFSVRGDLSDPHVKAGKEGAFKNAVEWFIAKL